MKNQNQVRKHDSKIRPVIQARTRPGSADSLAVGRAGELLPAATVKPFTAKEFKVISLRDCPLPYGPRCFDTPDKAAVYWRLNIEGSPYHNAECECCVVLVLDARRRIKGHQLVSIGTIDTCLASAREVFRGAIVASAAAIILMHNHPSGDPNPSPGDLDTTRRLIRAGRLLGIELLDHIVMGKPTPEHPKDYCSLRELGWFWEDYPGDESKGPKRGRSTTRRERKALKRGSAERRLAA
jgi:hypothetical protein